jgi:hypothetical protein
MRQFLLYLYSNREIPHGLAGIRSPIYISTPTSSGDIGDGGWGGVRRHVADSLPAAAPLALICAAKVLILIPFQHSSTHQPPRQAKQPGACAPRSPIARSNPSPVGILRNASSLRKPRLEPELASDTDTVPW